jgi:hypothetical protein
MPANRDTIGRNKQHVDLSRMHSPFMNLTKRIKFLLGRSLSPLERGIVVNSYGRSGSTMLVKSIIDSIVSERSRFYKTIFRECVSYPAWDLNSNNIESFFVYKTHDYPPQKATQHIRYIYIFSDPVEVVLSLLRMFRDSGSDWMRVHFQHLKSDYVETFYSIIDRDTLGLERHFQSWLLEKRLPVAFVRYETLWQNAEKLKDFLEISLHLPPHRQREARKDADTEIVEKLEHTYDSLRSTVFSCEDFFIINC